MKKETIYFLITIAALIGAAAILWYQFANMPIPEFSPGVEMNMLAIPEENLQQEVMDIQVEDTTSTDMQNLDQQVNNLYY